MIVQTVAGFFFSRLDFMERIHFDIVPILCLINNEHRYFSIELGHESPFSLDTLVRITCMVLDAGFVDCFEVELK